MAMTAIVQTVQGQSLTFLLTKTSLDTVVSLAEISKVFPAWDPFSPFSDAYVSGIGRNGPFGSYPSTTTPTQQSFANAMGTNPARAKRDQVTTVLREALIGGGMASTPAIDTAERIYANQMDSAVTKLAATILSAAIAAG